MDNLEQWFLCLLESEDEEFIVHNVEYNLGTDLTNKKLWKLYIKYLKDGKKYHDMVIVYSKYCNFFLDDTEMLKEYQNLKNIVKVKAENVENRFYLVNKQSYNLQMCQKSLHYNIFPQTFTFPTIFIRYFLDTADPDILHNLYQTCKYFYRLHSKPLCHQFVVQKTNVAENLRISYVNITPKTVEIISKLNFGESI
uniref:F-box domain-containing protein n=1 Tax=Panagrolaimus superbus TaxID=310955 RepID=A0A914YSF9_9BILA